MEGALTDPDLDVPVLIAGAGIAGLSCLRAFRMAGIEAQAWDARAAGAESGLAINLPGNAVAALDRLGLVEMASSCGAAVARREYRSQGGRLLFSVDERAFWGRELTPRCMRRGDLTRMLSKGVPEEAVVRGRAVTGARSNADAVTVVMEEGRELSCGILVGADGIGSVVRESLGVSVAAEPAVLASASWRFMARDPGISCWTLWAGREAMILLIPCGDGEVYGWAAATRPGRREDALTLRPELFTDFPAVVRRTVEGLVPASVHHSPLEEVRTGRWTGQRTVLIGDAAHATAPVWAQGAALAMEDGIVLAEMMATHSDWRAALSAYEGRRRGRIAHVQAATDRMSRAARLPTALRDMLMPFVGPRSYRATYGPLKMAV